MGDASVIDDAASVIAKVFDEASDATRAPASVGGLVDGNNHQIDRIETEATTRGVEVTVVVDFIHVLEYSGRGVVLLREGEPAAEAWVRDRRSRYSRQRPQGRCRIRRGPRLHGSASTSEPRRTPAPST